MDPDSINSFIDKEAVLLTLKDLVAINSVNPDLEGGLETGEAEMARYVSDFFERHDVPYERQEVMGGRHNVLGTVEGEDQDRTILFEAHMDTASVADMTIDPFSPEEKDGLLYGRGSCDTKGSLATMLHALLAVKKMEEKPPTNVVVAGVVDEELYMRGAMHLGESGFRANGAVVGEPTELRVIRAHKGVMRWWIVVNGKAAHSSKPHLGINAITKMAAIIQNIQEGIVPTYAEMDHSLTGGPTLNIGKIEGGIQVNFVPNRCAICLDRRVIPGEDPHETLKPFEELLEDMRRDDPDLDVKMETPLFAGAGMETSESAPIVKISQDACKAVTGYDRAEGVPYGTDAAALSTAGIPCVVLGPGSIDQAHGAVEYIDIGHLEKAVEIYARIMLSASALPKE